MRIRALLPEDAPAIAGLAGQLGYPVAVVQAAVFLKEIREDPEHALFVGEDEDGRVLTWIHVYRTVRAFTEPFAEVGGLVVDESSRGQGMGKALLEQAEGWAQSKGCSRVIIRSNIKREGANHFYLDSGYTVLKTQTVYQKSLEGEPPGPPHDFPVSSP